MDLIGFNLSGKVLAVIEGEWHQESNWTLRGVKVRNYSLSKRELKDLENSLYKNKYGLIIKGGRAPGDLSKYWDGVIRASERFSQNSGIPWGSYIDNPEFVQEPGTLL
jgi:hypothetical protein